MQNNAWREYAGDFNSMSDAEIDAETAIAQNHIDENESWVEAVAAWKAAGKPRNGETGSEQSPDESPADETPKLMTGIESIAAERQRQVSQEGWTPEHDDTHAAGEMAHAAACYVLQGVKIQGMCSLVARLWPWSMNWWKPKDPRADLVRAGALIVAEIDRLDRAAKRDGKRVDCA